jgi:inosose dehydratase
MMNLKLGQCPVSWGVEVADDPTNVSWQTYLDEAAEAGYHGVELGPLGYLPTDPSVLLPELEARGLQLCAGYVMEPLADPAALARTSTRTRETAAILAAAGAEVLVVIDDMYPARASVAGRSAVAERLDEQAFEGLVESAQAVARIAKEEFGLVAAFHHHVGTYVEFRDEVDRFFAATDPSLIDVCVDSGHAAYAGIDPIELFDAHADRVRYLHLKDVDPAVLARVAPDGLSFDDAVAAGMFCPLGRGAVDYPRLFERMEAATYQGWVSVEQDRMPKREEPARDSFVDDARASFRYVLDAGQTQPRVAGPTAG